MYRSSAILAPEGLIPMLARRQEAVLLNGVWRLAGRGLLLASTTVAVSATFS